MNFYTWLRKYAAGAIRLCMRVKTLGKENEVRDGAVVVCANHTALTDVFSLAVSFERQLRYLAKAELFKIPLLSQIIKALGAFPVDRAHGDVGAIKKTLALLSEGDMVGMFPQGTRCRGVDPKDTKPKNGVGMIIFRAKCPVTPVYVKVKNFRYRFLRRKTVIIGKPIAYEEFGFVNGGSEEYERAAHIVWQRILSLADTEIGK